MTEQITNGNAMPQNTKERRRLAMLKDFVNIIQTLDMNEKYYSGYSKRVEDRVGELLLELHNDIKSDEKKPENAKEKNPN